MKKILIFVFAFFTFIFTFTTVQASEVKYTNIITDSTNIEDDFKILNLDIEDYYKPIVYDYQKYFVVAMSEAYIDADTVQTYFYLYKASDIEDNTSLYLICPEICLRKIKYFRTFLCNCI